MTAESPYREVEIKLLVADLAAAAHALEAAGAHLAAPRVFEKNVRYTDAAGLLHTHGRVLRLRHDTRTRLTYKEENADTAASADGIRAHYEAETEVGDFDAMHAILEKLGYTPFMVYEKYRTTYTLDGAEIVLDEMPYGHFIEIEGEAAVIERLIARLGLGDAPRVPFGYVALFALVRAAHGLTFTDLSFANFAGVTLDMPAVLARTDLIAALFGPPVPPETDPDGGRP
jgi:adenylate cyclase class 2